MSTFAGELLPLLLVGDSVEKGERRWLVRCLLFLVAWKEGCCCGGGEVLRACAACVCACVPCYEGSARGLLACGVHLASWCHGGAWCLPLRGSYKHTHTHTHTHGKISEEERKIIRCFFRVFCQKKSPLLSSSLWLWSSLHLFFLSFPLLRCFLCLMSSLCAF